MIFVLVLLVSLAAAEPAAPVRPLAECGFPNKTDVQFHTYNCDESLPIQVSAAVVLDAQTQQPMYPVDVKKALIIKLKAFNKGDTYEDNKVDVDLAEFSYSWVNRECRWNSLPTFGLLKNIDGCEFAHNCPLQKNDLDLLLPLDLSKYSKIIKFLTGKKSYQLRIEMKNGLGEKEKIACVMAQLKFN